MSLHEAARPHLYLKDYTHEEKHELMNLPLLITRLRSNAVEDYLKEKGAAHQLVASERHPST